MATITPIHAVLDTSALYGPRQRRDLQQLAQRGVYVGIWSPWIITELTRVLTWQWMREHGTHAAAYAACSAANKQMMTYLLPTFTLANPLPPYPPAWAELTDEWDMPIWAAAKTANAAYVVSENTHDFPPQAADGRHLWEGIEYLRGADFIARLVGAVTD